ncbi:MAG: squalene/phytoene synthase family protein [Chloroflexi bacterium]|nr:squalene/phytoene synthase family protein [Chloroflexota bacterium]
MADLTTQANIDEANAYCERLARSHYENFSVVSWAFPKRLRRSMYSVYAYCRYTDDLGDEAEGDRLSLIDAWEADLRRCYDGTPEQPILQALQQTIHQHDIPIEPFLDLIESERLDQRVKRHPTYEDLLHYCAHSAAPVGRMVLYVFGYRDQERQRLSDATCNALQLANFWQDVKRDHLAGRVYLPHEDMVLFGVTEQDLAMPTATPAPSIRAWTGRAFRLRSHAMTEAFARPIRATRRSAACSPGCPATTAMPVQRTRVTPSPAARIRPLPATIRTPVRTTLATPPSAASSRPRRVTTATPVPRTRAIRPAGASTR